MKKKLLLTLLFVVMTMCLLVVSVSAETAYINANGEQVEAGSADIAYEFYITEAFNTGGNCRIREVYLYDTSITKIVIPAIKFTHSNGTVYDLSTYNYCRLANGWDNTLAVYPLSEKNSDTKTSLHTQITEVEIYVPILPDGASGKGNFAGYTALEKVSFFSKAYEPQNKGGSFNGCTNLKEMHFYGQNNYLSSNFFPDSLTKIVFHRGSTSSIKGHSMNSVNGKECTVYLNNNITPWSEDDPRLTGARNGDKLKFVLLVDDTTGYTPEEIACYQTEWQAGKNPSDSNYKYTATIQTYCDFYKAHISEEAVNDCVCYCNTCKSYGALANPNHALIDVYDYANGYSKAGEKAVKCKNEGCLHIASTEALDALFVTKGYSKDTTSNAIHFDFSVNNDAIKVYEAYLKNVDAESTVSYGVVVAVADLDEDETNDTLFNAEGELKAGTVEVKFNEKNYSNIKIKLTGIGEGNYDTALHISGYFKVNDGVTYINDVGTSKYAQKVTYNSLPSEE